MGAPSHTELVGLRDDELLALAPDATHQHYKGGVYRDLGTLTHFDHEHLGEILLQSPKLRAYVHRYPHEQDAWVRKESEFFSMHEGAARFRLLSKADHVIPNERMDHGKVRDADTGEDYLVDGKPCRLITENGVAVLAAL